MDGHGPSDPPPERPPRDGVFEPVALTDDHPRLARWVVIAALGLAVVIVKPWDPGGGGVGAADDRASTGPVAPVSSAAERSTPSPPAQADTLTDAFCLDRGQWLVVSVERRRDRTFRVWRALDPVPAATGPDDPAIPLVPVVSDGVLDLGWCAPRVRRRASEWGCLGRRLADRRGRRRPDDDDAPPARRGGIAVRGAVRRAAAPALVPLGHVARRPIRLPTPDRRRRRALVLDRGGEPDGGRPRLVGPAGGEPGDPIPSPSAKEDRWTWA